MTGKRSSAAAALLGASALLPGCYFAKKAIPTDLSGMDYPAHWTSMAFKDQVVRTKHEVTGLPASLRAHFRECWKNLTTCP